MKIIYVAKHDSGGNDDEGAIAYALTELGHEVQRVREVKGRKALGLRGDLLLFHGWRDVEVICGFAGRMPRIFWYFDLVDFPDPSLKSRCQARITWINSILPHIELGFCTDGDWVAKDTTSKLVWLPQGADGRVIGLGTWEDGYTPPILFAGIRHGGGGRTSFVDEISRVYADKFLHISRGVYGRKLADLITGTQIIVAPDSPITDRYWSNRVYVTLGFGGFLLHPRCEGLTSHYEHDREIIYYIGREDLHSRLCFYMKRPSLCREIAEAGLSRTLAEHTYRHRCEKLLRTIKERL